MDLQFIKVCVYYITYSKLILWAVSQLNTCKRYIQNLIQHKEYTL